VYQYDQHDQRLIEERVTEFRDQTRRFLAGNLTEDQFRTLRLLNGLYVERFAPMLRVAIPYGELSSTQLRKLTFIARTYDRGYGHITTRQNIQFNWPALKKAPEILEQLASAQMHAIQSSGNCIRNTTTDHLAGVTPDEIEDPRPYCEIIRQWSTLHPEFSFLPRKFKIAVTGAAKDRAASQVHDIGLHIVRNGDGETGFQVYVGGGQGRTPVIGVVIREFLPKRDLLTYFEAILRVYNLLGRRDNKHEARIKILVRALGIDRFREMVEEEWQGIRSTSLRLHQREIDNMFEYFRDPPFTDGRVFGLARLIRKKAGFEGVLQANGDYLPDQISFMKRVGFDSFSDSGCADTATDYYSGFYQPDVDEAHISIRKAHIDKRVQH
jgi:sulfite reductase (NADPH) hemoprotein beta-component